MTNANKYEATITQIDGKSIWWQGKDGKVHVVEGADVHPGVRLFWTLCEKDVPANKAYTTNETPDHSKLCANCASAAVFGKERYGSERRRVYAVSAVKAAAMSLSKSCSAVAIGPEEADKLINLCAVVLPHEMYDMLVVSVKAFDDGVDINFRGGDIRLYGVPVRAGYPQSPGTKMFDVADWPKDSKYKDNTGLAISRAEAMRIAGVPELTIAWVCRDDMPVFKEKEAPSR